MNRMSEFNKVGHHLYEWDLLKNKSAQQIEALLMNPALRARCMTPTGGTPYSTLEAPPQAGGQPHSLRD